MAADASIFSQYLRPVRSVAEYASDMDAREQNQIALVGARRQNELGALQLDQTRGQISDAAAKRNALQSLYADPRNSDPMARETAMLGNPLLSAEGQAARKARLDAEHLGAQTGQASAAAVKSATEADGLKYKLTIEKQNKALEDLAAFRHPGEALADLQRKAQAGEVPPDQAQLLEQQLQSLRAPQQWDEWQTRTIGKIYGAKWRTEQEWKAKEFGLKQQNELIGPDGEVNQPLVRAKSQVAQAGAQVTMGSPVAVTLPGGGQGYVQPANRPGAAPTLLTLPGAGGGVVTPPPKDKTPPVEFTKSVAGLKELENGLKSYEQALKDNGGGSPVAMGERRAKLQSSYTSLQMGLKNAFELGALAGPDLTLLEGMLSDPVSIKAATAGEKGLAAQIASARQYLKNRGKAVYEAHSQPVPSEYLPGGKPVGLPDVSDIDAEIARRRGGK